MKRPYAMPATVTAALLCLATGIALAADPAPAGPPAATVDLATREGVRVMQAEWRYSDTRLMEVDHRGPGPDLKPSGPPNRTWDFTPHAGARDFDDRTWAVIDPTTLTGRRSTGKLCFNWYRIRLTVPERVGGVPIAGSTLVFETVVDDYAEVWVDGALPRQPGDVGGPLIAGWNAPNRLVIGRNVQPGETIQLAVFGINGPISDTPGNFIWMRSARLDVYAPAAPAAAIERLDPALDAIVPADAAIERVADGFYFTEGPIWLPEGALLFSDPNSNVIYRWSPQQGVSVFRDHSGYSGADIGVLMQPGSNGLTLDPEGRLTLCEHGNRRVTRLESDGSLTVLADRYQGKRLNSPNDLVYRSDGTLFFTDPPFGLPKFHDDPRRELPYTGVYSLFRGRLQLVSNDLTGPNGIAFSPDERTLYVSDWDVKKKIVMKYRVTADARLEGGRVFFDMAGAPGEEALDGLKVDERGNVYASGPGGIWILSPEGRHLGTIRAPEPPANFAWGDADGKTLYMTARSGLYRVRLAVSGIRPALVARNH